MQALVQTAQPRQLSFDVARLSSIGSRMRLEVASIALGSISAMRLLEGVGLAWKVAC